jgi:protein O-mannosyl-transferase
VSRRSGDGGAGLQPRPAPGLKARPPFWQGALIAAALVALNLFVYAQVRRADFVQLDDPGYVQENTHVAAGLTWASAKWAFTTGHLANWHPLTWLSHMLDVQFFGVTAGAHHVTNVALHILNTLVLFGLLRRMTAALWPSAIVAALFAVHPLHVESVAWISERKDVLSTFFWLLTMWAYVSYVRRPGPVRYGLVLAAFALGLMSKPMLVTLPIVLLLIDFWPLGRSRKGAWSRLLVEKLPLIALAVISSVITFVVQRQGGAVSGLDVLPWDVRITNALVSFVAYIAKTLWPAGLVVFYPHARVAQTGPALVALAILVAISFVAWRVRRRAPYLLVGWLWYLVTLVPVIGFIQVGTQALADRYTYVPLIGLFIALTWTVSEVSARWSMQRTVLPIAAAAMIVMLAVAARAQASYWRDNATLWRHALEATPENYRAHNAVGSILGNDGKPAEALAHFVEAARLQPDYADAYYNLGRTYADLGRLDESVPHYRRALALRPGFAEAHNNLGLVLSQQGHEDEAMAEYETAAKLEPDFAEAHANLAVVLVNRGAVADARRHAELARQLNPKLAGAHYALGFVAMSQGRFDDAMAEFTEALRLNPNMADAHNNLGFLLAGQGGPSQIGEAITHFKEAVRLKPNLELAHMYLALALGGTGKLDEAELQFREVLRINPKNEGAQRGLETIARIRKGRGGR